MYLGMGSKATIELSFVKKVEPIETNIIIFEIDETHSSSDGFTEKLLRSDIHIISMGQGKLRMVTHMDYTDTMHSYLLERLRNM